MIFKKRDNRHTQKILYKKIESFSRKSYENMENFLQQISDIVKARLYGMNSVIVKMKEDDRFKKNKKYVSESEERNGAHIDRNQDKTVISEFLNETWEPEVVQLLKESTTEIEMTMGNLRIKKDAERQKFISLANIRKKKLLEKK